MSRYSDDSLVLTLVRQADVLLQDLGLPASFTLDELCGRIEARRGRHIRLGPHAMPPGGPHGMWVKGESDDYIFFDQDAPPLRRLQIIGHELGHILFDDPHRPLPSQHTPTSLSTPDAPPGVSNAATVNACTRTAYEDIIEQRCEWFGTLVAQRTDPSDPIG